MSRLTKKPIAIKEGVTITETGGVFTFKGPKGELTLKTIPGVTTEIGDGNFWIRETKGAVNTAHSGTLWSLAKNAIEGVADGFLKTLEIEGVGYRAVLEGKELVLFIGYALPVRIALAEGVMVAVEKNTIKVSGIDKDVVGRAAAEIRSFKKPEPYKGKGIHYQGEVIRRKVGKKAGTTA